VFSARTAIRSASVSLARAWSDQAIPNHVDFHTLERSSKRDSSLHRKGGDGARRLRGSFSYTSCLVASWLVALQDSQHVSDNEGSLTVLLSTLTLHLRRTTLPRQ
jgi:hypothetical protein